MRDVMTVDDAFQLVLQFARDADRSHLSTEECRNLDLAADTVEDVYITKYLLKNTI